MIHIYIYQWNVISGYFRKKAGCGILRIRVVVKWSNK